MRHEDDSFIVDDIEDYNFRKIFLENIGTILEDFEGLHSLTIIEYKKTSFMSIRDHDVGEDIQGYVNDEKDRDLLYKFVVKRLFGDDGEKRDKK